MAKKKSKHRRVDFSTYKPIHDRGFNPAYMEQLQDSLIARNYNEPQRLAFLSTALHESGGDPKAVVKGKDKNGKSVKFSGLYQWGDDRFPNSWNLGDQIHYALESAESNDTRKSWTDGGSGVPYIRRASEGREAFWNSKNPYEATLYFNKGYVRPAEEQARINRAEEAANMAKNLFYDGGPTFSNDEIDAFASDNSWKYNFQDSNNNLLFQSKKAWNNAWKSENIGNSLTSIAGGLTDMTQSTMANAKIKDTTGIQTAIDAAANTTFGGSTNEQLLAQYNAIEDLDRTSQRDLTGSVGSKLANTGKATLSGVQAGMQIGGPIGGILGGAAGLISSGIGLIVGDTKAKNEAERLNREAEVAEQRRLANFDLSVNNLEQQNLMYDMANYAKYGGKINIKPSKRGTFTRTAKSRGLGVQEFASKVLANPDDYSEAMRKKAQFAKNASKGKHDEGGFMESYANPSTVTGAVAKSALQLLDPTGISSYPDVYYSGKELFNNPSWENAGMFGLNIIGALPLIGKVSAPFKAAKTAKLMSRIGDASDIVKAADKVGDANKVIDTLSELIPITRNIAAKTQDITTSLISDPLFQLIRPDNKLDVMRAFRVANAEVDVINAANNSADIVGIIQDIKDANKKADGGPLFNEFSNGITKINEGGSHEENPYDGVQVGVDNEGIPNLVEEGELILGPEITKDNSSFVMSDSTKVSRGIRTKYKLRDNITHADAAKEITKMSEEMPNDPIVRRTKDIQLQELMIDQEQVKMKKDKNKRKNKFDYGGIMSPLEYIEPALSIGQGLQSLFIKPDYSHLDAYEDAINAANIKVSSSPVKTNMRYTPMDTRGLLSEASANRAATNRALMNTSGANPAIARTALTNADYNYNTQLGKLWRSIEEAEYNRQLGFEQFRTNLEEANRARDLQVQSTNAEILNRQAALRGDYANRQLAIDNATSAVISGNIDAAKQSLAGLARQSTYANWIKMLQDNNVLIGPDGSMIKLKKEAKNGGKIKRIRRLS